MPKNWDDVKSKIRALYIDENRPLEEVRRLMKKHHHFDASVRAYKNKLVAWRFLKNSRRVIRADRSATGRGSSVVQLPSLLPISTEGITDPIHYLLPIASSSWSKAHAIQSGSDILALSPRVPGHHSFADYSAAQTAVLASTLTYGANRSPTVGAADLDIRDASGKTRLHHAVIGGDYVEVEHLLSTGLSLDVHDNDGYQAIHHAACRGFDGIIQLLLKHGAKVNARGPGGKTPMHLAVESLKAIRSLLKSYPTLSLQDDEGNTALHILFLSASPDNPPNSKVLEMLIEAGANVDTPNGYGITPLQLAIDPPDPLARPYFWLANILLRNKINISLTGSDNKPYLERLLDRGNLCWTSLSSSRRLDFANETCKLMIRKGASPNVRLKSGELLLHEVLTQIGLDGDYELLQLLCEKADVEAVAQNGDSPLHSWVKNVKNVKYANSNSTAPTGVYVKILIENGVNPNAQNNLGNTPLLEAVKLMAYSRHIIELTEILLKGGADPMIPDSARDLPIYVAARYYDHKTLQSLVQLLVESYAETYPTRPLRSLRSYDMTWWTEYGKLLRDKHWQHETHMLADAKGLPKDIREPLGKLLMTIAAKKIFPFAQATFKECKDKFGFDDVQTQLAQSQIVLILRDCKALDLDIDQTWYQFLLELFP